MLALPVALCPPLCPGLCPAPPPCLCPVLSLYHYIWYVCARSQFCGGGSAIPVTPSRPNQTKKKGKEEGQEERRISRRARPPP